MSSVPQHLRSRIDAAAQELIAVAESLRSTHSQLAKIYAALGEGITATHRKKWGGHFFMFVLPDDSVVEVQGTKQTIVKGPATVSLFVESSFYDSLPEDERPIRKLFTSDSDQPSV